MASADEFEREMRYLEGIISYNLRVACSCLHAASTAASALQDLERKIDG